ncbi:unnamed protein product [Ectocarpus sp. 13 AM-2016]
MMASMMGYSHIVKTLLEKGANVSSVTNPGITALHIGCAQEGPVAVVELLIGAGADVEATSEGWTPLHGAAEKGSREAVRALVKAGANPDRRRPTGVTPLHIAARSGRLDTLRELLRLKANPLLEFEPPPSSVGCGSAPLDIAAQNGHSDIVRELVQQLGIEGCDPKNGGEPALYVAASEQHVDIMAILTNAGVVDTTGLALLGAAGHGREVSVKFLLRQRHKESKGGVEDAYMNARNIDGYTPLVFSIHSCFSQAPRIARLLADAGADMTSAVQVINSMGELVFDGTPLAFTTSRLREKIENGQPATEEHLHTLEAIRRLLLRVEAVHAVSWLWPSDAPFIGHAAGSSRGPETNSPSLRVMLPILKRRTKRRGVLAATLLRYSVKA